MPAAHDRIPGEITEFYIRLIHGKWDDQELNNLPYMNKPFVLQDHGVYYPIRDSQLHMPGIDLQLQRVS